ncbi:tropomyosin-1, isoforms 33/34-like isoform X2 [Mustela putorius furo]|uniref:Tropomyosin-1, isoforms 33/34-like isoform X2 n=1 Tax=Mustela putorius furo TaxID=9669 RepID=A0A8U0RD76_MUSPF|nr:tropomyosin-1, isoforms 33/34-like isoform X2 [Mustela putorius furo]
MPSPAGGAGAAAARSPLRAWAGRYVRDVATLRGGERLSPPRPPPPSSEPGPLRRWAGPGEGGGTVRRVRPWAEVQPPRAGAGPVSHGTVSVCAALRAGAGKQWVPAGPAPPRRAAGKPAGGGGAGAAKRGSPSGAPPSHALSERTTPSCSLYLPSLCRKPQEPGRALRFPQRCASASPSASQKPLGGKPHVSQVKRSQDPESFKI